MSALAVLLDPISLLDTLKLQAPTLEVWFAVRTDGKAGKGTRSDPFSSIPVSFFDAQLQSLEPNSVVHFGPGVFETKGGNGNGVSFPSWTPKIGQRFIGSGINATFLRLINATQSGAGYAIIGGNDRTDGVEVSDMTLDCNMENQLWPSGVGYPKVMTQGIFLVGLNIRVRRVRVINAGNRIPAFVFNGSTTGTLECFPIFIGAPRGWVGPAVDARVDQRRDDPLDFRLSGNLVEDCIVEQPDQNNARETTSIHVWGTIRNCFVNSEFVSLPLSSAYGPLTISSVVLLATNKLQLVVSNQSVIRPWQAVVIAGLSNPGQPNPNGTFALDEVTPNPASNTYTLVYTVPGTTVAPTFSNATLQRISPRWLPIKKISLNTTTKIATVETYEPHGRVVGMGVSIAGARDLAGTARHVCNGTFRISTVVSTTEFEVVYVVPGAPSTHAEDTPVPGELTLDRFSQNQIPFETIAATGTANQLRVGTKVAHYKKKGDYVILLGVYSSITGLNNPCNGYFLVMDVVNQYLMDLHVPEFNSTANIVIAAAYVVYPFQALSGWDVRNNRVCHSLTSGPYHDTWFYRETIAKLNYFYDVYFGLYENLNGATPSLTTFRVVFNSNVVELSINPTYMLSQSRPAGCGGSANLPSAMQPPGFETVLASGNLMRFADGEVQPFGGYGIIFPYYRSMITENNIAELGAGNYESLPNDRTVQFLPMAYPPDVSKTWGFNNHTFSGQLQRPISNGTINTHTQELADDIENFLLS